MRRMSALPLAVILWGFMLASNVSAQWWKKNLEEYSYKNNAYGYKGTATKIYVNCMLANDSRHRILVGEDWSNKIKALGYDEDYAAYRVISINNAKKKDDLWTDASAMWK